MTRLHFVFVSHSSQDQWVAGAMAEKIEGFGAKAWLDQMDVEGGDVVLNRIEKGIDACQEAVVLVTPASVESQWVMFEIGAFRGQHKRVTPILYGVSHDALKPLRGVNAVNLNDFNIFLSQLSKRMRKITPKQGGS